MKTNAIRRSNFELLRFLCIIGIVCMHIIGLIYQSVDGYNRVICIFLNSIFNANVSIFVLISGYFGIKKQLSKLLSMEYMVLFYSIISFLVILYLNHDNINNISFFIYLLQVIFPTLTMKYWFFSCYVILFFLAPYIELMFQKLSLQLIQRLIIMLLFFFSIAPTFLYIEILGDAGKGIVNMLLIYMIGRYFSYYGIPQKLEKIHLILLPFLIIFSTFFNTLLSMKFRPQGLILNFARDNSLFTIGIAICIFIFFHKKNLYSALINNLASFVFPIYLVNETIRAILHFIYPFTVYENSPYMFFMLIAYTLITLILGIIIELIRRLLFTKLEKYILPLISKKFQWLN